MYIYKAYSYSNLASTLRPWLIIIRIAELVGTPFWWVVRNVLSVIEVAYDLPVHRRSFVKEPVTKNETPGGAGDTG